LQKSTRVKKRTFTQSKTTKQRHDTTEGLQCTAVQIGIQWKQKTQSL